MRKELYNLICDKLQNVGDGAIKHIDLWNHNVEYIEQEESWARPAVFVEFMPIQWNALVPGEEYRAEPKIALHIVTDWPGSAARGSEWKEDALGVYDLSLEIHKALTMTEGETFMALDLIESQTNHNHEEILETIDVYNCVALRHLE